MKNVVLLFLSAGFALTACGPTKSNPIEKYQRAGLVPANSPETLNNNVKQHYIVIENNNNVLVQVDNKNPQATDGVGLVVQQNAVFQVSTPENINFIQEKESSFEFTVKFLQGKVKFELDAAGFPSEAKMDIVSNTGNSVKYKMTWSPKNLIVSGQPDHEGVFKVDLKNIQYVGSASENDSTKKAYEALRSKSREIPFVVRKDDKMPKLEVKGLEGNRKVGEVHKFSVEVTAPAGYTDETPLLPTVFYDTANIVNAQGLVEANGAYFVAVDPSKKDVEKISAGKWRVNYVFNTKDVTMLPQFDKTLQVVNADKLVVRVSFKIASDKVAVSERKSLRFNIDLKP